MKLHSQFLLGGGNPLFLRCIPVNIMLGYHEKYVSEIVESAIKIHHILIKNPHPCFGNFQNFGNVKTPSR